MKVVLPAGGLGTRFLPLTKVVPKELLPLGELPLLHHGLREAEAAGFEQALIVTSPNKPALRSYFDADPDLERLLEEKQDQDTLARLHEVTAIAGRLQLEFVEQPQPLGLGDAVARCRRFANDAGLAVLLPDDVVLDAGHWQRLFEVHSATGAAALCLRRVPPEQTHRYGIAVCRRDGYGLRVEELIEKPSRAVARSNLAVFGRYLLSWPVLEALDQLVPGALGELQLTDAFAAALGREPGVRAIEFDGEYFDSGTPEEYWRSLARYTGRSLPNRALTPGE